MATRTDDKPAPLTAEEVKEYVESGGVRCPKCKGQTSLDADSPKTGADDNVITCNVKCSACGYEFVDIYTLTSIEAAEEFTE